MDPIKLIIVDDEPIIRKALKLELNASPHTVACGMNDDGDVQRRQVVVLDTFASGPQLMAALDSPAPHEMPDYLLLDMELQGEPTAGISIANRVHRKYPDIRIAILSGRFDNPTYNIYLNVNPNHNSQLSTEGRRPPVEPTLNSQPVEPTLNSQLSTLNIARVVFEALRHGAQAFISKNAAGGFSVDNILRAIESLERGEQYYFNYPLMLTLKETAELYLSSAPDSPPDINLSDRERQLLLLEAAGCTAAEIATSLNTTEKSVQESQKDLARRLDIVNKSGSRIAKALQYHLINPKEIQFLKR